MLLLRQGRRRFLPLHFPRQAESTIIGSRSSILPDPDPLQCDPLPTPVFGAGSRNFRTHSDERRSVRDGFRHVQSDVDERRWRSPWERSVSGVLHQRRSGIVTTVAQCEAEEVVRSPLSQAPGPVGSGTAKAGVCVDRTALAVLTGIRQSPEKLNLVAEMVRGMRVEDALTQMQVSVKRAAKIVYKVIHSAQANAVHNFGLEKDRLVVNEAFVGKDKYLKRFMPHGKGKAGLMEHARSRLTVVVKEMSLEQETDLAKLRLLRRNGTRMSRSQARLVPHLLRQTQWKRQRAPETPVVESA